MDKIFQETVDKINALPLPNEHKVVAGLLVGGAHVTQRNIVDSAGWLGCHPKHEKMVAVDEWESTTRQVRQIIRDLRITYGIPVLSDSSGYYLPATEAQAKKYLDRMEKEARARASAALETYRAMKAALGISSPFFDAQAQQQATTTSTAPVGTPPKPVVRSVPKYETRPMSPASPTLKAWLNTSGLCPPPFTPPANLKETKYDN